MLEQLAKALHERRVGKRTPWENCDPQWKAGMRKDAHAAVEALRDPPDEILLAAGKPYGGDAPEAVGLQHRREAWNKMLDAILDRRAA